MGARGCRTAGATLSRRGARNSLVAWAFALALTGVAATAYAAPTWQLLGHGPFASPTSVQFIDASHGWVVGETVWRTSDGGRTWAYPNSDTNQVFEDAMFVDASHGWAVGYEGIASSDDGGATWTQRSLGGIPVDEYTDIRSVWFSDVNHGWIVGGMGVAHTSDGGAHWTLQNAPFEYGEYSPTCVRFSDGVHGVAVNQGGMLLTTSDGGAHWKERANPLEFSLDSIAFRDATHAYVGSAIGLLSVSIDGSGPAQEVGPLLVGASSMVFTDAMHGWAASDTRVWSTSDGGTTWFEHDPHIGQPITGLSFADKDHGWLIGSAGAISATSDGGVHWTDVGGRSADIYSQPIFVDATHGWMISSPLTVGTSTLTLGTGAVLGTTDGGQHWERLFGNASMLTFPWLSIPWDGGSTEWREGSSDYPVAISFADASHGVMAGISGGVYMTDDGGRSWSAPHVLDAQSNSGFAAVCRVDESHAWVLSRSGGVFATHDAGAHWQTQRVASGFDYDGPSGRISFADAENGCAVLSGGTILRTSDGGDHWHAGEATGDPGLTSVSVVDSTHAWASGSNGTVLFSADGGATWARQSIGTTQAVNSIDFSDAAHGRALAAGFEAGADCAFVTSDGGSTWTSETADPFLAGTFGLSAPDATHAWAVGYEGIVMRRVTDEPLTDLEPYPTGWVDHPVQVSLTATPGATGSAIADTFFATNSSPAEKYAGPFSVSTEGTTSVAYWSVDSSGTAEPTETALYRIDYTPPTGTFDLSGPYRGERMLRVSASDALSGVDFTEMWTDDESIVPSDWYVEDTAGNHTVYARIVDNAGNERTISATFTVLPPFACKLTTPKVTGAATHRRAVTLSGRITPAHKSSFSLTIQRRKHGRWQRYATVNVHGVSSGKWTAKVRLPKGIFRARVTTPRLVEYAPATSQWRAINVR